jgi:hypothetical protein
MGVLAAHQASSRAPLTARLLWFSVVDLGEQAAAQLPSGPSCHKGLRFGGRCRLSCPGSLRIIASSARTFSYTNTDCREAQPSRLERVLYQAAALRTHRFIALTRAIFDTINVPDVNVSAAAVN